MNTVMSDIDKNDLHKFRKSFNDIKNDLCNYFRWWQKSRDITTLVYNDNHKYNAECMSCVLRLNPKNCYVYHKFFCVNKLGICMKRFNNQYIVHDTTNIDNIKIFFSKYYQHDLNDDDVFQLIMSNKKYTKYDLYLVRKHLGILVKCPLGG
jgi:hypothetical protein